MVKIKQSRDDLLRHLREQVGFLQRSGEAFDRGILAEAKRLATSIRILIHDTRTSHSLLEQLAVKEALRYMDTSLAPPGPGELRIADAGLAFFRGTLPNGPIGYDPVFDNRPPRPPLRFVPWWTNAVLKDRKGGRFSRKDLVLGLSHLDGGAHVDPELEAAYAALSRSNSLGWSGQAADGSLLLAESPVLANVRQVAFELQTTIEQQLSELLT
jgi:hypothetical protein